MKSASELLESLSETKCLEDWSIVSYIEFNKACWIAEIARLEGRVLGLQKTMDNRCFDNLPESYYKGVAQDIEHLQSELKRMVESISSNVDRESINEALDDISGYKKDWDGHGALPISKKAIKKARKCLTYLESKGFTPDHICPNAQQGVTVEYGIPSKSCVTLRLFSDSETYSIWKNHKLLEKGSILDVDIFEVINKTQERL